MQEGKRIGIDLLLSLSGTAVGFAFWEDVLKLAISASVPIIVKELVLFIKKKYAARKKNNSNKTGF